MSAPAPPRPASADDEMTGEGTILDGRPADVGVPREVLAGRLWICGSPVDWDAVAARSIDAVVDVDDADADRSGTPSWVDPLPVVRCPLVDGEEVKATGALVDGLAGLASSLVRDGRRVLVHCGWGRNRSGLVVSATVMDLLGVSGAEALEIVRAAQPRAVNNEGFAAWLQARPRARDLVGA